MLDELLIENYLKGKLNKQQEKLFVKRIKTDDAFKEKVLVKVVLIRAIRNVGKRKDERIIKSVKNKLTWKKYILIYGMYGNYYFTDNLSRYNNIFNHKPNVSIM